MQDSKDTNEQPTLDVDEIISDLDTAGRELPVQAIREARKLPHLIVPKLIEALQDAAKDARDGMSVDGQAHFFALYLLAEFRAGQALPAIVEAVSLPGDLPFDLFGDAITEDLARILATLASDQLELFDALIDNSELNEYVRWEAAQAFWYFVRDGRLTREQAVDRLAGHLRHAIENDDHVIAAPLVSVLARFGPAEVRETIVDAFQRGLIDPLLIGLQHVDDSIQGGQAKVLDFLAKLEPTNVDDTIEELRTWSAFNEQQPGPGVRQHGSPATGDLPPEMPALPPQLDSGVRGVGRNKPCPCGSGKKFKKCCGSRQSRT